MANLTEKIKPIAQLTGENCNVFNLTGICVKALKREKQNDEALDLMLRVLRAHTYDDAIVIMGEYCELN